MSVTEMVEVMEAAKLLEAYGKDPERYKVIIYKHWNCPEFDRVLVQLSRSVIAAFEHEHQCIKKGT